MLKKIAIAVVVFIAIFVLAVNYRWDLQVAFGRALSDAEFNQLIAVFKILALALALALGILLVVKPVLFLSQALPRSDAKSISKDLEDAQEYASEILRRLIRGLPLEMLFFKIAGTERRHIHSYSDKVKQKTTGVIMLVIGIYTALAIHYLIGDSNSDLIGGKFSSDFDPGSIDAWVAIINSIARQHSLAIGLIFSFFVVSIDRLIVSDHSLEYRLFKIRFQSWVVEPSSSNGQPGRWGYLFNGEPLKLPVAAQNSLEWSKDAASLFHPRAFFSTALILILRLGFAWFTSILVTNAFLLKIYEKDVISQTNILASEYGVGLAACEDSSRPTLGCAMRNSELKMKKIESDVEIYEKAALDETQVSGKVSVFCRFVVKDKSGAVEIRHYAEVPRDGETPQETCDGLLKKGFLASLKNESIKSLEPVVTSGRQTKDGSIGNREQGFRDLAKAARNDLVKAKEEYDKNKRLIDNAIQNYGLGISVRLEALDKIKSGKGLNFFGASVDENGEGGHKSEKKLAHIELSNSLRVLLMAFEIIPILMLKVVPLLGWMPSLYVWSYCVHRIGEELKMGSKLTSKEWPIPFSCKESQQKTAPQDATLHASRASFAEDDVATLVVGLLNSLRLPLVMVTGTLLGIFMILKPLVKFLGLSAGLP